MFRFNTYVYIYVCIYKYIYIYIYIYIIHMYICSFGKIQNVAETELSEEKI